MRAEVRLTEDAVSLILKTTKLISTAKKSNILHFSDLVEIQIAEPVMKFSDKKCEWGISASNIGIARRSVFVAFLEKFKKFIIKIANSMSVKSSIF